MEHLVLFGRVPVDGGVKTRLTPPLTPSQARRLHVAMFLDQITFLRGLGAPTRTIEVRVDSPWSPEGALGEALRGLPVAQQGGGDLGARIRRALDEAFTRGAVRAGVLGADAPTLPAERVEAAFARLAAGAEAAVVPAWDGGYVFIGTRGSRAELFEDVPWGTAGVLAATRRRAAGGGLRLEETSPWGDVDAAGDLRRLAAEIAADPERAPATAAELSRFYLDFGGSRMV